jgi:hypothetical protein
VASELDGQQLDMGDVQEVDVPFGGQGYQVSPSVVDDSVPVPPVLGMGQGLCTKKELALLAVG